MKNVESDLESDCFIDAKPSANAKRNLCSQSHRSNALVAIIFNLFELK